MALKAYKKKRTFSDTPEPTGGKADKGSLRFVVQMHKASRLHYDFRLEMHGVLKSWAVPKGPSLNPEDKRLAIEVEDHPFDYKDFEGVIPKGNYGAGTVIVWDEGTYETLENNPKNTMEKSLLKQWKEGSLKFRLHGSKLSGAFALVKMKSTEENAWLLIKHDDEGASHKDITRQDQSVVSGKTLEEVTKSIQLASEKLAKKKVLATADPDSISKKAAFRAENDSPQKRISIQNILKRATDRPFPVNVPPMLATLVDTAFDDANWEFEVKWDGYRATAYLQKNNTTLKSRNGNSFAQKFHQVFDAVKNWPVEAVVDGEIVAVDGNGIPSFGKLQNWTSQSEGKLLFYAFDLLWYKGKDMTTLPLSDRKTVLQSIIPEGNPVIRIGYTTKHYGVDFFNAAAKIGLEGIIAKRSDSRYFAGERSRDWLKIKLQKRQEVVIGGYTRNEGTSKPFSALLLGVFNNRKFTYVGRVGTGFKDHDQKELIKLFTPLEQNTSSFCELPDYEKKTKFNFSRGKIKVTWLRPEIVCEIHYTEVTEDGLFRHPAFIALRGDKQPKDIMAEIKLSTRKVIASDQDDQKQGKTGKQAQTLIRPGEKEVQKKINGNALELTNLEKVFWPAEGYTKGDMLNYYAEIAKYIIPYLKDRPQSLNRFPNGIDGNNFYQKDVTGKVPVWIDKYPYKAEGDRRKKHYMLCNNEAALLYMANLGAIEMNPWSSTIHKPDYPTWCILDLDPDKGNSFDQVIEVARAIHDLLEDIKIPSYCKTSGSTGLHVYIPLGAKYTYEQSQLFAKWIASEVNSIFGFTSIERMTGNRVGKIYIDYLQNRPAATLAAPYSLRPKPRATVSMPLHWEEVKSGLKMTDFTIQNAATRLRSEGDLFKPVLGRGISLKKILDNK